MSHPNHPQENPPPRGGFWKSRVGLALIVFLIAGGALLGFEHRAHLFAGYGPLVLLLALCLGMHLFMHGGHGGHGGGDRE